MRSKFLLAGFIFIILAASVMAQQPAKPPQPQQAAAGPAPTKIGVVDLARALGETAEGQRDFAAVQTWINLQQETMRKDEAEYNSIRNKYMQDQLKMTPEARADREREIQDRETKLRRKQEDLNQELGLRRQDIINRLGVKMQQVIQQYAQESNYLMVLVAQEGLLAYVAPSADLTAQLVKLYNSRFPAGAPAPPKKPQ